MTGPAHYRLDLPVVKGTCGLLVQTSEEIGGHGVYGLYSLWEVRKPAVFLLPNYLGLYAEKNRLEEAERYGVMECRECGSCAYVCPSRRPLTQWIKDAKRKITAAKKNRIGGEFTRNGNTAIDCFTGASYPGKIRAPWVLCGWW